MPARTSHSSGACASQTQGSRIGAEKSRDGEGRKQRSGRHQRSLKQQIRQRALHRHGEQRDEHAVTILEPVERRPALGADQAQEDGVGGLTVVQRAQINARGERPGRREQREPDRSALGGRVGAVHVSVPFLR